MWSIEPTEVKNKDRRNRLSYRAPITLNKFEDISGPAVVPKRKFAEKALQLALFCLKNYPLTYRNFDNGGIYNGAGGLAFTLLHLSECPLLKEHTEELRGAGLRVADAAIAYCKRRSDEGDVVSFLYGKGGIYATCAALYRVCGRESKANDCLERYVHGQWVCKDLNFSLTGSDDLANGRTGYIAGLLWLSKYYSPNEIRLYALYDLLRASLEAGRKARDQMAYSPVYADKLAHSLCSSPIIYLNMGSKYLGTLMGLGGVLRILLLCPFYLYDMKKAETDTKAGVDFLLSLQAGDGSFPDLLEEIDSDSGSYEEYAQWKTGAAGMGFLMAAAYNRWKDERYLHSCLKCCEFTWEKGLTKSTYGLADGIAGSCYLFLLVHRITGDVIYLHRALNFAEFLISDKYLEPLTADNQADVRHFSLMEGLAGVAVLLVDMIKPEETEFPFLPVFDTLNKLT